MFLLTAITKSIHTIKAVNFILIPVNSNYDWHLSLT